MEKVPYFCQIDEVIAKVAVLIGGTMHRVRNHFYLGQIGGEIEIAARDLSFVVAVAGKLLEIVTRDFEPEIRSRPDH